MYALGSRGTARSCRGISCIFTFTLVKGHCSIEPPLVGRPGQTHGPDAHVALHSLCDSHVTRSQHSLAVTSTSPVLSCTQQRRVSGGWVVDVTSRPLAQRKQQQSPPHHEGLQAGGQLRLLARLATNAERNLYPRCARCELAARGRRELRTFARAPVRLVGLLPTPCA